MRKVLIIEDDYNDFKSIANSFSDTWEIIPNDYTTIAHLYNEFNTEELKNYIKQVISENYRDIGMIILDITLFGVKSEDKLGLDVILPIIRSMNFEGKYGYWGSQVPIIAYTRHNSIEHKERALKNVSHVHCYITKKRSEEDETDLLLTAEALYSLFNKNINGGHNSTELFVKSFNNIKGEIREKLELLGLIISDIQKNTKETKSLVNDNKRLLVTTKNMSDVLLSATLIQMSNEQLQSFLKEFAIELKNSGYETSKLEKRLADKDSIKTLSEAFKDGSFTDILEYLHNLCDTCKVFQIPGGVGGTAKIISHMLITLTKILSK